MPTAKAVLHALKAKGNTLVTVESCTGGMIAAAMTDISGSSEVLERGYVTYSNAAKSESVGVDPALIDQHGAVSEQVARAMATGGLSHSHADIAIAVTGIAGPGGSDFKPEGLVHFCAAHRSGETIHIKREFGPIGRSKVRQASVDQAFQMIIDLPKDS
jgi:nicotinamide-nucleotide amidase